MGSAREWGEVKDIAALRDRIAAVLLEAYPGKYGLPTAQHAASAVLAELDLTKEFGCNTDARHGCRCSHRYATHWEINNID